MMTRSRSSKVASRIPSTFNSALINWSSSYCVPSSSTVRTNAAAAEGRGWQAWTLNMLANSYSAAGQPARAVPLYEAHNHLQEKAGSKMNLAIGLGAVASAAYLQLGMLRCGRNKPRRRITLGREVKDEFQEAVGHGELGRLLAYRGAWDEAEREMDAALELSEQGKQVQSQGVTWAYRALTALLRVRDLLHPLAPPLSQAWESPFRCASGRLRAGRGEGCPPHAGSGG